MDTESTAIPPYAHKVLQNLREQAGLSQTQLAERLNCTPSRISRLESAELKLDTVEAIRTARAIGTPEAEGFADYLQQKWSILIPRPSFNHVSRAPLWDAEQALSRLQLLCTDDPNLRHAFVQQVDTLSDAIRSTANYLFSTEHPVAFIGRIGVGKTTAICALADLRDLTQKNLQKQTLLHTGTGRTTICEVEVRHGGQYAVKVDPCTDEEMRIFVSEFCDYLLRRARPDSANEENDDSSISHELARALRNMTGLVEHTERNKAGDSIRRDLGKELVEKLLKSESDIDQVAKELRIQVWTRLNLVQRTRTSISFPGDSAEDARIWLRRTFRDINIGKQPEFSLPKRIEVSLPYRIFSSNAINLRLIDTRGIDEPKVPRRDLQTYIDDPRAVIVLSSGFNDAPDAAIQSVIERTVTGGSTDTLQNRSLMLILTKGGEEANVNDDKTGEPVSKVDEGRLIKKEQIRSITLTRYGIPTLPVQYLDSQKNTDSDAIRGYVLSQITQMRDAVEKRMRELIRTADRLIADKDKAQVRATYAQAMRPLRDWLNKHTKVSPPKEVAHTPLPVEIGYIRYASTLRASVNRKGDWYNFNFWHAIGFGLRINVNERTKSIVSGFRPLFETAFDNEDLETAHGFLRHIQLIVSDRYKEFLRAVEDLGDVAFTSQLKLEEQYWNESQRRWGQGLGYKNDIQKWTGDILSGEKYKETDILIENEIQRKWGEFVESIQKQLATVLEQEDALPETSVVVN